MRLGQTNSRIPGGTVSTAISSRSEGTYVKAIVNEHFGCSAECWDER